MRFHVFAGLLVVGAGFYGSTTALRLAEYNIFETVVLTDILEGKPEGLALDMNQSRCIEGFETKIIGATTTADGAGYEATAKADVVVITAGLPRKPGMSRMDVIGVNAGSVRGVPVPGLAGVGCRVVGEPCDQGHRRVHTDGHAAGLRPVAGRVLRLHIQGI